MKPAGQSLYAGIMSAIRNAPKRNITAKERAEFIEAREKRVSERISASFAPDRSSLFKRFLRNA